MTETTQFANSKMTPNPDNRTRSPRLNERKEDELRQLSLQCNLLSKSDGSCQFSLQNTRVLASVHGPATPKSTRKEIIDRARIEVYLKPSQGQQGSRERDFEAVLRGIFDEVCQTQAFPRKIITITLQVLNDDGSLLSCALMAATGALIDAGIPMTAVPAACCAAITQEGSLLLDQDASEEESSKATLFVCTKDDGNELLSILSEGMISRKELKISTALCTRGCSAVRTFLSLSLKEQEQKRLAIQSDTINA